MRPADLSGDLFPPEIPASGNPRFEAARQYAEQLVKAKSPATKKMLQRQVVDSIKAAIGGASILRQAQDERARGGRR